MLGNKYIFVLLCLFASAAYGDAIYKWVDENGKVQYGNEPPKNMKDKASMVDTNKVQSIGVQHFESNSSRVRKEETSSKDIVSPPASSPADSQPDAVPEPAAVNSQVNDKKKQCEEEWARYKASLECFAPYVTVGHGVKAEGFERCTVVKQPLEICD